MERLKVKKLSAKAIIPVRGSDQAAGYDLFAAETTSIQPMSRQLINTDIAIAEFPPNTYGRIAARSGLAIKNGIDIGGGVIDRDYRGSVYVNLINNSREVFEVTAGMRIAQLICERCSYPEIEEVDTLSTTSRGAKGFGSTGLC